MSELLSKNSTDGFVPTEAHVSSLAAGLEQLSSAELRHAQRKDEYARVARLADDHDPLVSIGEKIEEKGGKDNILAEAARHSKGAGIKKILGITTLMAGLICAVAGIIVPVLPIRVGLIAAGAVAFIIGICLLAGSAKSQKALIKLCNEYGKPHGELEAHLSLCLDKLKESRILASEVIIAESKLNAAAEEAVSARSRLGSLLDLTDAGSDGDVKQTAKEEIARLSLFCAERDSAEKEIYALEAVISSDSAALAAYDRDTLRQSAGDSTASLEDAERMVKFNKAKKDSLDREISHLRENLAAQRAGMKQSPVEISDHILELEEELKRDAEYFEALMLAKQSIEQASMTLSGNVTPDISKKAGDMLALISGGKHASVQTTKNFDLSVEQDGFGVASELLSGGTRDAAYICLRIALMLRLFGDDLPPLIMDESLCQLDDGRAAAVLGLLNKLADIGLQCVILTCHSREEQLCAKNGYTCNRTELA